MKKMVLLFIGFSTGFLAAWLLKPVVCDQDLTIPQGVQIPDLSWILYALLGFICLLVLALLALYLMARLRPQSALIHRLLASQRMHFLKKVLRVETQEYQQKIIS